MVLVMGVSNDGCYCVSSCIGNANATTVGLQGADPHHFFIFEMGSAWLIVLDSSFIWSIKPYNGTRKHNLIASIIASRQGASGAY